MDAQRFLAEFGHIAGAPGGIGRLRELILHLAISGDLAASINPISAAPLLTSIDRQKREHPEQKKVVAKQAPVPRHTIKSPAHWAPCRVGDLTLTITGGGTPSRNNSSYWGGHIPWASVKDLKDLTHLSNTEDHITPEGLSNSASNLIPCGRVIVCTRMGLGKAAINTVPLAINQDLKALELPEEVNAQFFLILYKTRELSGTGTTVAGIKQDHLLALPVSLPPVDEQCRIVAKVDELMTLCDKLEAQQQERHKLQNALRQSTLQAVATANSPHELQAIWTRLAENFRCLFHAREDIRALRDVVFDLALRGIFLPDTKISAAVRYEEMPPLPTGWTWTTIDELAEYITSGSRGWKGYIAASGDVFIRSQDIKHDALIFENPAFVALPKDVAAGRTLVRKGDLLLTITGGNVGRCAMVPELGFKAYVSQHVALIRPSDSSLSEFIHFWLKNAYGGQRHLSRYIYGDKAGLNLSQVASIPVPKPPETALESIVASLHRHQSACDRLAKQIDGAQQLSELFAREAVASITGIGAAAKKDTPVKAPETELVAPLRLGRTPDIKDQAPLATLLARHQGEMSAKDLWQRFGGEIDAFYAQLKTEVAQGWILEPGVADVREKTIAAAVT